MKKKTKNKSTKCKFTSKLFPTNFISFCMFSFSCSSFSSSIFWFSLQVMHIYELNTPTFCALCCCISRYVCMYVNICISPYFVAVQVNCTGCGIVDVRVSLWQGFSWWRKLSEICQIWIMEFIKCWKIIIRFAWLNAISLLYMLKRKKSNKNVYTK